MGVFHFPPLLDGPIEYRGFTLDRFQEQAINHLKGGRSVLVAAPTGTGKTIIADWIVEEAMRSGRQVIYTAPIKALSNQKFRDYCKLHGEEQVGLVTGDLVIRREAPCRVMTTEILRNMLLGGESFDNLLAVVIDEVHFLDDRERGTVWEEVLIYLPPHVLVVALSATLPNLAPFAAWLAHVRGHRVEVVTETERTVPLQFYVATRGNQLMTPKDWEAWARKNQPAPRTDRNKVRGGGRGGRGRDHGTPKTHPLDALRLVRDSDGFPCLYFVFSRKDSERFAKSLAHRSRADLTDEESKASITVLLDAAAEQLGPHLDEGLRDMYLRGIAFHHAGLHVGLKGLVEELYEARLLRVLFCTSTFALGINMPARSVIFHGLHKFDGQSVKPLTTRGFMQKAGRAGRRGLDDTGHVVLRLDPGDLEEVRPLLRRYSREIYEPVRSSFNLSWNSIVNLLDRHTLEQVRTIVDSSFLAWHRRHEAEDHLKRADQLEAREEPTNKERKESKRLRRRALQAEDACWDEFLRKRDYLQRIGYLGGDDTFKAGAGVLKHLQIAEIFMTELVLAGALESLDESTLFGVLCAITNDLPRAVSIEVRADRKDRELVRRFATVRHAPIVTGAEAISNQPVTWGAEMIPLGRAWANGMSLEQVLTLIHSPTDFSGSLITGFRRAKDLLSQLKVVFAHDEGMVQHLRAINKAVSRDEVEVVG